MNLRITFLKKAFLLPILLAVSLPSPVLAAANHSTQAIVQHCFEGKKAAKKQWFRTKILHHSKATGLEKKKTDKLALAVFIGGLASFLLVFPVKFFLGFAILGLATLITSIFALRRIKRDGTRGRWLVILGILLVLIPSALFGLVFAALGKL